MLKTAGTKNRSCNGGEPATADDGTAQRGVLFAALAETKGHRHHPDDHGKRRHQHRRKRPNPASSAATERIGRFPRAFPRAKLTTRMLLAVATPMHMMAPVKAGTLIVVCVTNNIQTMPAIATGSAVTMMKGSSHD